MSKKSLTTVLILGVCLEASAAGPRPAEWSPQAVLAAPAGAGAGRPSRLLSRPALVDEEDLSRLPDGAMDLGIAAGPESVLETSNFGVAIVTKDGEEIARTELWTFFRPVQTNPGRNASEHRSANDVDSMFDRDSERFFVSAVARSADGAKCLPDCEAWEYLAVSKTATPTTFTTADWHLYQLPVTPTRGEPVTYWSDGTRIAASQQFLGYHSELYRFDARDTEVDDKVRVLDKRRLVRGQRARWTEFRDIDDLSLQWLEGYIMPEQITPTRTLFVAQLSGCRGPADHTSRILVLGFDGRRRKPRMTRHEIVLDSDIGCGAAPRSPQPGDVPPLQNYASPFGVYRDGSLWLTHAVKARAGGREVSAVRLVEVDVSGWPDGIALKNDLVLATPGRWKGFPAVGVDAAGNVLVAHSSVGPTQYASVAYTWSSSKPNRSLARSRVLKAGTTSFAPPTSEPNLPNMVSFADYYAVAVDPTDDSMWIIGQYAASFHRSTAWVGRLGFSR